MPLDKVGSWTNPEEDTKDKVNPSELTQVGTWQESKTRPASEKKAYQTPEVEKKLTETGDVEHAMRISKGDLDWSLRVTRGVAPDTAARVKKLADESKLPRGTVKANVDTTADMLRSKEVYSFLTELNEKGQPKRPYTTNWLTDPDKMAMAKDDVETLAEIEDITVRGRKEAKSGAENFASGLGSGLAHIYSSFLRLPGALLVAPNNIAASLLGDPDLQRVPPKFLRDNALTRFYDNAENYYRPLQVEQEALQQIIDGEYADAAENIALQITTNLPQLSILAAAAVATGGAAAVPGLTSLGALEFSSSFEEQIARGKPPAAATSAALSRGAAEILGETVTFGLLKNFGKQIVKQVGKEPAKELIKRAVGILAANSLNEGTSEALTSGAQDFADFATGDKVTLQGAVNRSFNAFLVGSGLGFGIGASSTTMQLGARSAQYVRDAKSFTKTVEKVDESKLKDRSPEELENFIDENTKVLGEDSDIYLPLQPITEFYQEDPEALKKVLQDLGIEKEAKDAEETGTDLKVNRAKWIVKYGNEDLGKALKKHIRFTPEGMSEEEAAKTKEDIQAAIKDVEAEIATLQREEQELPEDLQNIRTQLIEKKDKGGFGLSAEDASFNVDILQRGLNTFAKERGESLQEALRKRPLRIEIGKDVVETGEGVLEQRDVGPLGFFSKLQDTVETFDFKTIPAKDLANRIQKTEGIKKEELEQTEILEWLDLQEGKVAKEDVVEFLREGGVHLEEVVKGKGAVSDAPVFAVLDPEGGEIDTFEVEDDAVEKAAELSEQFDNEYGVVRLAEGVVEDIAGTKFEEHTIPGGENYREVLLILPEQISQEANAKIEDVEINEHDDWVVSFTDGGNETITKTQAPNKKKAIEVALNRLGEATGDIASGTYQSAHWDEPNVLAHLRLNDRVDSKGNKTLFIEEIQSDWHQEARKKGFKRTEKQNAATFEALTENRKELNTHIKDTYDASPNLVAEIKDVYFIINESSSKADIEAAQDTIGRDTYEAIFKDEKLKELANENARLSEVRTQDLEGVPDAPFKATEAWSLLAFKRALRLAVEEGYDAIAWTPGEIQNERYDLSKHVSKVNYRPESQALIAYDLNGKEVIDETGVSEEKLEDFIGKEPAKKLIDAKLVKNWKSISGLDLKVGGTGMVGFYDKLLPKAVGKYVKKLDKTAKVGVDKIATEIKDVISKEEAKKRFDEGNTVLVSKDGIISDVNALDFDIDAPGAEFFIPKETQEIWHLELTDKIKSEVLEGQTLFQKEGEGKPPRGSIKFTDKETLISLYKSANMSTLLHEGAHLFTNEMKSAINAGVASEQMQKDYNTLVEFSGDPTTKKGQEKLARGFEAYLREGKAPSVKLTRAFDAFRKWLESVYRSVKALNVDINDEIRGVFDRMLASDAEIKEAARYYNETKPLEGILPATKKQSKKLKAHRDKAESKAKAQQLAKYMDSYLNSLGGREKTEAFAIRDVDALPLYTAINFANEADGIGLEEFTTTYGKPTKDKINTIHKGLITEKGKTTIAEMALEAELESEADLVEKLLNSPSRKDAIETRTNELIEDKERAFLAELNKDQNIPGEESYHSDENIDYLAAQLEFLLEKQEKVERRREASLKSKAFKDAAAKIIGEKKVKEATRYDLFSKAEQKFSRQVRDFAEQNKLVEASEAQIKQTLNSALVNESVKAREAKDKILKRYKANTINSRLKNIENSYRQAALNYVSFYGLSTSENVRPKDPNSTPDIHELDEVLASNIPTWILQKQPPRGGVDYKDLTMDQLKDLDKAIQDIIHVGRGELLSFHEPGFETVADVVEKSVAEVDKLPDIIMDETSFKSNFLQKIDALATPLKMIQFVFERLDGYQFTKGLNFGPMTKLINRGRKSEADFQSNMEEVQVEAAPHWDTLQTASKRINKKYGSKYFQIEDVPVTADMKAAGKVAWTSERLMAFVLNMGNAGNLQAMINSYEYTEAQMATIVSQFQTAELNALQGVWDATNKQFPALNQVHFNMYNSYLDKVEAQELVVKSEEGDVFTLEGGYYPLVFDHMINDFAEKNKEARDARQDDMNKNRNTSVFLKTKPEEGFTYSRTPGHALPPVLSLNVWHTHIADTARYISHAEYLRDMNRVVNTPEWRTAVRKKAGRRTYQAIKSWLAFQALPERKVGDGWERHIIDHGRRMATLAILGANIPVGIKQRVSLINAMNDIGIKYMMVGLKQSGWKASLLGTSKTEAWQKIMSLSKDMRIRQNNIDRDIKDTVNKLGPRVNNFTMFGKNFTWRDVQDFMFSWIQMNDRATVGIVWLGAFNKALDAGKSQAESVEVADTVIHNSQPSSLPMDLSAIQRSEGAMRLFTAFSTFTMKYGNRLMFNYRAWQDGSITTKEYMRHQIYDTILPSMAISIISSFFYSGDLPEFEEMAVAPVETMIGWAPFVRDIASFKYGRKIGESPAFEGLNRVQKLVESTVKGKDFEKILWDAGKVGEFFVGVPALKIATDTKRAYDLATGKKKKRKK